MMERNKNLPLIVLIGVLLLGNAFFGIGYFAQKSVLDQAEAVRAKAEVNTKVVDFTMMFIKQVLQAEKEVDFETRLRLENAVRDLKDDNIVAEWQVFTNARTEIEAQNSVKRLLEALVGKIQK